MRKSRKNVPDLLLMRERFTGLTQAQIRALLEADELATHAGSSTTCTKEVAEHYRANGLNFDSSTAIFYARVAEQNKHFGTARAWYESAAERGNKKALLEFRRRINDLDETAGPTELRSAAHHYLASARSDFNWELSQAIKLFARLNDRRGIEAALKKAITILDSQAIEYACVKLHRTLTRHEHIAYARALVKDHRLKDAVTYAERHSITKEIGRLVIERAIARGESLVTLRSWANRLGFNLPNSYLERFIHVWTRGDRVGRAAEIVGAAEVLAFSGNAHWERRLLALYRAARNEALSYHQIKAADRYAKKCEKPLTVEECMRVVRDLEHEARNRLDWAVEARDFALARAASLLHHQAPRSPVTARKPAASTRRAA